MSILPQDLLISTFNTSNSGWVVNDSGVRIYHKPTGINVKYGEHKNSHRNRQECLILLEEELCYLQKEEDDVPTL